MSANPKHTEPSNHSSRKLDSSDVGTDKPVPSQTGSGKANIDAILLRIEHEVEGQSR